MNLTDSRYNRFSLVKEMLATVEVVKQMEWQTSDRIAAALGKLGGPLLLSGEGSSRIFPGKRARVEALRRAAGRIPLIEGSTQALEYPLSGGAACVASNSGKTKEGLRLIRSLKQRGIPTVGIVAWAGTPIAEEADYGLILSCGEEQAVAATKSVIEQALVYQRIFSQLNSTPMPEQAELARNFEAVLTAAPPAEVVNALQSGKTLYWAGRNDGVAEELSLKSNEIARRKSGYLEGTYAVHGIEEVLEATDTVILIDPFPEEEEKFRQVLVDGVGLRVIAVASRPTSFPTFEIPALENGNEYLQLAAGWNLLIEAGIALNIDLDNPVRARKVGNEMEG